VSPKGVLSESIVETEAESTFVNYFWTTFDTARNISYILSGDENSIEDLNVVLHTTDLTKKTVHTVELDRTAFTLATIHVDSDSGILYGISPGLFGQSNWAIVKINPQTGNVTLSTQIKTPDQFDFFFGGGVYNGITSDNGVLITHVFRRTIDQTSTLVVVNANTGDIVFHTSINSEVNNQASFLSIVMATK